MVRAEEIRKAFVAAREKRNSDSTRFESVTPTTALTFHLKMVPVMHCPCCGTQTTLKGEIVVDRAFSYQLGEKKQAPKKEPVVKYEIEKEDEEVWL